MRHRLFYYLFIVVCMGVVTSSESAMLQQKSLWSGLDLTGPVFNLSNWEYDLNVQARYNFTDNQYQSTQSEAGLAYKPTTNLSLWLGYTNLIHNADETQQHRIWEQALWNITNNNSIRLTSRTRLEERTDIHESQWSTRLRQRLQFAFPKKILNTYTPIIYDELFFNLNNPTWVNNQLLDQNRIFIGLGIPLWKKINVQVGYLNQYQIRNPENKMNHILYANLNIKT